MDTLIQAAGLTRTGRGRPTHASGGEIDHVLAGRRHAGTVGEAKLLTWHGKDHDCVYACALSLSLSFHHLRVVFTFVFQFVYLFFLPFPDTRSLGWLILF